MPQGISAVRPTNGLYLYLLLVYYSAYVCGFLLGTQFHGVRFADMWLKYAETNKYHLNSKLATQ